MNEDYQALSGEGAGAGLTGAERIAQAFARGPAFIGFLTGGDPTLEDSFDYLCALVAGGADIIEIGIPFSDPIAEGPVIQAANLRALANGTTLDRLFQLAARLRCQTDTPIIMMGYLNPVFHYGYQRFAEACRQAGVDGLILADLPFEERAELGVYTQANGIALISLIAPTSAEQRVTSIAREAEGFIYLVSSLGVTGMRSEISTDLPALVRLIRSVSSVPVAVGFGIHSPEQARQMSQFADGVIVGSALVQKVADDPGQAAANIRSYVQGMKAALRQ
ncbi:MAG: tryptophan synthase subunit alpha [Coriobacteriia bacterium]|nr:tryptophan synthase subunit alpha [Coriobacteriia bacterium]